MTQKGLLRDVLSSSAWTSASLLINRLGLYAASVITARAIGPEGFGIYSLVTLTMLLFAALGAASLGSLANKYVAELKHTDPERTARVLGLSFVAMVAFCVVLTAAMALSSPWVCRAILHKPHVTSFMVVGAFGLAGQGFMGLGRGILSGLREYRIQASILLWGAGATLVFIAAGALLWGLMGAVLGMVLSQSLAGFLFMAYAAQRVRRHRLHFSWALSMAELRLIGSYWLPGVLAAGVIVPALWAVSALLVRQPDGEHVLGMYSAASQWRLAMGLIPMAIGTVVFTLLAEQSGQAQTESFNAIHTLQIRINWMVALPLAVFVGAASKTCMRLFGASFTAEFDVLLLMMLAAFLATISSAMTQAFYALDRMWQNLLLHVTLATLLVGLAWWLVPRYGATGAAAAFVGAYAVSTFQTFLHLRYVVKSDIGRPVLRLLPVSIVAMAGAAVVPFQMAEAPAAIAALVLAAGCCWGMFQFGALPSEQRALLDGARALRRLRLRPGAPLPPKIEQGI